MGLLLMVTHEDTAILNMSFIPSIVGNKKIAQWLSGTPVNGKSALMSKS